MKVPSTGVSPRMIDRGQPIPTDQILAEPIADPLRPDYFMVQEALSRLEKNPYASNATDSNGFFLLRYSRELWHPEEFFSNGHIPILSDPVAYQSLHLFSQIHQQGFFFNTGDGSGLSVSMVNAMDTTRPASEHELRLLSYLSLTDGTDSRRQAARLFAGVAAAYQTQRFEAPALARFFLGAGFEIGISESGEWMLHTYTGFPISTVGGGVEADLSNPYWEMGVVREGVSDNLFLGCSVTTSLFWPDDDNDHYIGLNVRYQY